MAAIGGIQKQALPNAKGGGRQKSMARQRTFAAVMPICRPVPHCFSAKSTEIILRIFDRKRQNLDELKRTTGQKKAFLKYFKKVEASVSGTAPRITTKKMNF